MIYGVSDFLQHTVIYFCPDQETVDQGKSLGIPGEFVIGTLDDAKAKLLEIREIFYSSKANSYTVCKATPVENGIAWTPIDLNAEPDNTDITYEIFNPINGSHNQCVGLSNAKSLIASLKIEFFIFYNLTEPLAMDSFPVPIPHTRGTQTL
jgi:hypothetical protein